MRHQWRDPGAAAPDLDGDQHGTRVRGLRFTPPANTSIASYSVWRAFRRTQGEGYRATLYRHMAGGDFVEWRHCSFDVCDVGDVVNHFAPGNHVDFTIPNNGLAFELFADAITDGGVLNLYAARMRLSDPHNPIFQTDPTGTLATQTVLRDTVTARFDVSDLGGGIHDVAVLFGEDVAASSTVTSGECDASARTLVRPCPLALDRTVSVDTTRLADGTYPVRLRARDVTGNERVFSLGQKTVDNVPPPANVSVPVVIGVPKHGPASPPTLGPGRA